MLTYPDFKEKTVLINFSTKDQKFSFKNDNIVIHDAEGVLIHQNSCHKLLSLWIVGNGTITTGLLERSRKFGFPILMLNINFRCIGSWNATTDGNVYLRELQYRHCDLEIAKHLVHNKLSNQVALLKSIRKKDSAQKDAIISINQLIDKIQQSNALDELMGIEGSAAKLYFKNCFDTLPWKGRKPRAKHDPINVVLDIGYTQLFYLIENMLNLYGFDIYKGVLHRTFYHRKSLVCDLQEPFRCIVDKVIKVAYNLSQLHEDDFIFDKGQYRLSTDKTREYTKWLLKGLLVYKHDIFLYCQAYYRAFIRQHPIEDYPVFDILLPFRPVQKVQPASEELDEEMPF